MTTAPIDRIPKACLHKRARHQHGDRVTYVLDRCRCLPCCYAASVYELERTKRNAYGRSNLVDAGPVREHVAALMAAGVGLKRIVAVSGTPQGVLWKLVYGKNGGTPSRRVTRSTADRLLALDPADPALLADGAKVCSVGTTRRLQALSCLGWSIGRLAAEAGLDRQRLDGAIHGRPVVAGTARVVAALYERLWDKHPPADTHREKISVTRTIHRSRDAGWAPPLAWDDESIDDPAALPFAGDVDEDQVDELAVEHVLDGHRLSLTGATLHAAVHALAAAGHQPAAIGERLGIQERQAQRLRDRAEPPRPKRHREAA
jgi:hypothetical protein